MATIGDFLARHWGDLASILGLVLTLWVAWRAKAAAEQARDAAEEVKARISSLDMLEEMSAAIATLEEIKRLQGLTAWDIVLDRYAVVRKHLVRVEQMRRGLALPQLEEIVNAIRQFRIIEAKVDRAKKRAELASMDSTRLNRIVADQADILERIKIAIKQVGA